MQYTSLGKGEQLKDDIVAVCIDQLFTSHTVSSRPEFDALLEQGRGKLLDTATEYCQLLENILRPYLAIKKV